MKPRKPARAVPLESAVQRAIIDRLRFCGVLAIHVPNAGKRTAIGGRMLKAEGMRTGWPDLACYGKGGMHALLEVKRPGYSASAVSAAQRETHELLGTYGVPVAIVTSQDEAVAALRSFGWQV